MLYHIEIDIDQIMRDYIRLRTLRVLPKNRMDQLDKAYRTMIFLVRQKKRRARRAVPVAVVAAGYALAAVWAGGVTAGVVRNWIGFDEVRATMKDTDESLADLEEDFASSR